MVTKSDIIRKYIKLGKSPREISEILFKENPKEFGNKENTRILAFKVIKWDSNKGSKKGNESTINPTGKPVSSFKQNGENAEYNFISNKRIISKDDLVAACDINLDEWDIVAFICNKWEVGAKDEKKQIQVTPLFQVKITLKPKVKQPILDATKALIEELKNYAPKYPLLKRIKHIDNTLFIIDPCDPHFGKYSSKAETGEQYNIDIAVKRYREGFEGLLNKGSFYHHEKIIIIGGNDITHTDNPFHTTTAGTNQDTDGMWHEAFKAAQWATIELIERAAKVADVHFVHCPSNHDFQTGFFLAQTIQAWFHNNSNVTFDISPNHRKYIHYGNNLIGVSHGDGAKELDLPNLMTVEVKKAWSESYFCYWYLHHRHHKDKKIKDGRNHIQVEKDGKGITVINSGLNLLAEDRFHVEYVRTITATDSWHSRNSHQHSYQGMEGFIHDPQFGQVDRISHLFQTL